MAFRRFQQRGRRFAVRRNANMRVWTAALISQNLTTGTVATITLADAASFATTSGNTKHIGTLVRIRGTITWDNGNAAKNIFGMGISLYDVSEASGNPSAVTYGQDEDMLQWTTGVLPASGIGVIDIDVKAKRRFDVETVVRIDMNGITNHTVSGNLRCLFLVP